MPNWPRTTLERFQINGLQWKVKHSETYLKKKTNKIRKKICFLNQNDHLPNVSKEGRLRAEVDTVWRPLLLKLRLLRLGKPDNTYGWITCRWFSLRSKWTKLNMGLSTDLDRDLKIIRFCEACIFHFSKPYKLQSAKFFNTL